MNEHACWDCNMTFADQNYLDYHRAKYHRQQQHDDFDRYVAQGFDAEPYEWKVARREAEAAEQREEANALASIADSARRVAS